MEHLLTIQYHVFGLVSVLCCFIILTGMRKQYAFIQNRRHQKLRNPTDKIRIDRFIWGNLLIFSFLIYGVCINDFDHYIVWTSWAYALGMFMILKEVKKDRRNLATTLTYHSTIIALTLSLAVTALGLAWQEFTLVFGIARDSTFNIGAFAVIGAIFLTKSYTLQALDIYRSRTIGGTAKNAHQLMLLRDAFMMAFSMIVGYLISVEIAAPIFLVNFLTSIGNLGIILAINHCEAESANTQLATQIKI